MSATTGGVVAGAYVVVTPSGSVALPAVSTTAAGTFSVQRVPVGSGTGTVALSVYPDDCTAPALAQYSGLTAGNVATINVTIPCIQPPGTIAGSIINSAGGYISGATVTVIPSGKTALPSVTSQASGTFVVPGVPIGAGTGTVSVSTVPGTCSLPPPASYSGLVLGRSITITVTVTCTAPTALSLGVGQSAIYAAGPVFQTELVMPANAAYLISVVNTDTSALSVDGFTLAGSPAPSTMLVRGQSVAGKVPDLPGGLRGFHETTIASSVAPVRVTRGLPIERPIRNSLTGRAAQTGPTKMNAWFQLLQRMQRKHMATLDFNRAVFARYGAPRRPNAEGGAGPTVHPSSLAGTTVGALNKIYVNKLTGSCDAVDSIYARTVYVGQYAQVVADTQAWAARPDSSFYAAYGSEFDAVTYPHLVTNIGDPLAYDGLLSRVGKITLVFTPLVNNGGDAGFVNGCDLYPRSQIPFSNVTEMIYGWTPDPSQFTVDFWERDFRAVTAHEAKHVVSLSHHLFDGAPAFEQSWLEEATAQQSEEIWMRHFNGASWRSNANYAATVGCETNAGDPCYTANNPYFFSDRLFYELVNYLYDDSSNPSSGGFPASVDGKYGGAWEFIRWATDVFGGPVEGDYIKGLIDDPLYTGMTNVSQHSGLPVANLLVYWSLATAFDSSTFTDSATFHPTDSLVTVPSFDLRNIFATAGIDDEWAVPRKWPANTTLVSPMFSVPTAALPSTAVAYFLLPAGSSASTESLELLAANGQPISPASGLRVGIIRVH